MLLFFFQAIGRVTKILLIMFVACAILDVPLAEGSFSKYSYRLTILER